MSQWGRWHDIDVAQSNEKTFFGIYQIRLVDERRQSIPVQRIGGIDEEGVIYIGRSGYKESRPLAQRIWEFQYEKHSGASTYALMKKALGDSQRHGWSDHRLQYRSLHLKPGAITESGVSEDALLREFIFKRKIEKSEADALASYFADYGELPPCNSSFPGKWQYFHRSVQESLGRIGR